VARPRRLAGAGEEDEQQGLFAARAHEVAEAVEAHLVGPLEVVEDHHERALAAQAEEGSRERDDDAEVVARARARPDVHERRVRPLAAEQLVRQKLPAARLDRLPEFLRRVVAPPVARLERRAEKVYEGPVRREAAALVIEEADVDVGRALAAHPAAEVPGELRLADARLALDDDGLAAPGERAPVLGPQQRKLGLAPDEEVVVGLGVDGGGTLFTDSIRVGRVRRNGRAFVGPFPSVRVDGDGGDEAVAAGVEGLDVARGVGRVAERAADLRDGLLEHGVGREDVGPDPI
jgi:hypothetical protein